MMSASFAPSSSTLFSLIAVLGLVALSGCGRTIEIKNPQLVAEPDKVSAMLAQAADRAANSLETLAAIEQTRAPRVTMEPPANLPPELQRGVTVNWVGPAENVTKMMAERAGYKFTTLGSSPPAPLVVTVDMENKPIYDVLRSIGLQLGNRADVRVDSALRVIELSYNPAGS